MELFNILISLECCSTFIWYHPFQKKFFIPTTGLFNKIFSLYHIHQHIFLALIKNIFKLFFDLFFKYLPFNFYTWKFLNSIFLIVICFSLHFLNLSNFLLYHFFNSTATFKTPLLNLLSESWIIIVARTTYYKYIFD